jgi:ribosomal protein S27AE
MFFVFGWGHQTRKQFDPGIERQCPQCHNHVRMALLNLKKWFTFFFIPVIPYGSEYFLACPTCGHAVKLNKAQFDELRHGTTWGSAGETYFGASEADEATQESGRDETFSAVTVCPNCSTEVGLSEHEVKARRYTCPSCKTTVRWDPA